MSPTTTPLSSYLGALNSIPHIISRSTPLTISLWSYHTSFVTIFSIANLCTFYTILFAISFIPAIAHQTYSNLPILHFLASLCLTIVILIGSLIHLVHEQRRLQATSRPWSLGNVAARVGYGVLDGGIGWSVVVLFHHFGYLFPWCVFVGYTLGMYALAGVLWCDFWWVGKRVEEVEGAV